MTSPADPYLQRISQLLELPEHRHLSPRVRKAALTAHVLATGTWLGSVVVNLFLGISAAVTDVKALGDAYYAVMDPLVNAVMPGAAIASIATGLLLSVATRWGLVRHVWILAKLGLAIATVVVGVTLIDRAVHSTLAARAAGDDTSSSLLLPGIATTPFLLASATTLSITKPWGRTPWSRRRAARVSAGTPPTK